MSYLYQNPRSQMGEISHQATVVFQAAADKRDIIERMQVEKLTGAERAQYAIYDKATLDMSVVRIDRGDLVFQRGTSVAPRGSMMNGAPPVSSHLNGIFVRDKQGGTPQLPPNVGTEEKEQLIEKYVANKVSESIRFLGVSLGSTVPNPDDPSDQKTQITVRAQGTMAIHHNGKANLQPGDTLLWKIPTSKDLDSAREKGNVARFGRNNMKRCLMTVPLRKEYETLDLTVENVFKSVSDNTGSKHNPSNASEEFASELLDILSAVGIDQTNKKQGFNLIEKNDVAGRLLRADIADYFTQNPQHMKNLVQSFYKLILDIERRKIGKVLSYAKPGEKVDIIIGSG